MRIVHASDWHGKLRQTPKADLYVFTGDMLPNFPQIDGYSSVGIDPRIERLRQSEWIWNQNMRGYLGSPDSPVVCVRGNHDFIDLIDLFYGCSRVELIDNEMHEILGLRVTGHRGIPYIYGGWSDEMQRPELLERVQRMQCADLIVTHYPPQGILDGQYWPGRDTGYGLEGMASALNYKMNGRVGIHCFGHIHERGGEVIDETGDDGSRVIFSNAACGINVIEI